MFFLLFDVFFLNSNYVFFFFMFFFVEYCECQSTCSPFFGVCTWFCELLVILVIFLAFLKGPLGIMFYFFFYGS